jgi:hypothetical protein
VVARRRREVIAEHGGRLAEWDLILLVFVDGSEGALARQEGQGLVDGRLS